MNQVKPVPISIRFTNICTLKDYSHITQSKDSQIQYSHFIETLQLYEPTINQEDLSVQYYDEKKKKWLFMYHGLPAQSYSEDEIKQFMSIFESFDRSKNRKASQNIPDFQENVIRNIKIRYKIQNQPTLSQQKIAQVTNKIRECDEKTKQFQRKFDGDAPDINIFWASPLFSKLNYKKENSEEEGIEHIKFFVNYQQPIQAILSTLKQSRRRLHLHIREFNEKSFDFKNEFSIVYLICHTEEDFQMGQKQKQASQQRRQRGQKKRTQFQQLKKEGRLNFAKNTSYFPSNDQVPQQLIMNRSEFIDKKREDDLEQTTEAPELKPKKESRSFPGKKKKVTYFVGETKDGEMIKIIPQKLMQMLKDKTIKLLILHTSYPYAHLPILQSLPSIEKIIIMKSNPNYLDKPDLYYLSTLFKGLLKGKQIQKAHSQALELTIECYPKTYVCCCYHKHKQNCELFNKCQKSKYSSLHYRHHYIRCNCENAYLSLHSCPEKQKMFSEIQVKIHVKNEKSESQSQISDQISKQLPKKLFFYCCCLKVNEQSRFKGLKQHMPNFKYELIEKNKKIMKKLKDESEIERDRFIFKEGDIRGDIDCMKGFDGKQKLIGNRSVILKFLRFFVQTTSKDEKAFVASNIFGSGGSGKSIFTNFVTDLLLRKKIFKVIKYMPFKKFTDLELTESKDVLYVLSYKPKHQKYLDEPDFDNKLEEKYKNLKIRAIFITPEQFKLIHKISKYNLFNKIDPFSQEDCGNYFKSKVHMTQQMKDKVRSFFKLVYKKEWKDYYYPQKFDFDAILSTIAESDYSKFEESQVVPQHSSQYPKQFIFGIILRTNYDSITLNPDKERRSKKHCHHNNKDTSLEKEVMAHELRTNKVQAIDGQLQKSIPFSQILFQKFCSQIKSFKTKLLGLSAYFILDLQNKFISLFDATTDDPGSLINIFYRNKINEKRCQLKAQLQNEEHKTLYHIFLEQKRKKNDEKLLRAALKIVKNYLQYFFLFEVHDEKVKEQLVEMCLFIINYAVVYRKSIHSIKQQQHPQKKSFEQSFENLQPESEHKFKEFLDDNFLQFLKTKSQPEQVNEGNTEEDEKQDLRLSCGFSPEKNSNLSIHISQGELSSHKQIAERQYLKPQKQHRISQKQLIIKFDLLSRRGLLYLLKKLKEKTTNSIIKLLIFNFKLQLHLEEIFQSHHVVNRLNRDIEELMREMRKEKKLMVDRMELPQGFMRRLGYDNGICLILKATIGGRKALTRESLAQIEKFLQNQENEGTFSQDGYLRFQHDLIIKKLCSDKHVYNKITEKLMTYQRFPEEGITDLCPDKLFEEDIKNHSELVRCWNLFYSSSIEKSSKDFYETVCSLLEEDVPLISRRIFSSNIHNFSRDLEHILKLALEKLKGKMAVIFLANPVSHNSKDSSHDNFLINFSSIIQEQGQQKLSDLSNIENISVNPDQRRQFEIQYSSIDFFYIKMKLNSDSIRKLEKRKGCRYLIVCINPQKQNNTRLIGEREDCVAEQFEREQLAKMLVRIPIHYMFICLKRVKLLAEYINQKKVVCFDFPKQHTMLPPSDICIIMFLASWKIVHQIESGLEFEEAVCYVRDNIKIHKIEKQQKPELKRQNYTKYEPKSPELSLNKSMDLSIQFSSKILQIDSLSEILKIKFPGLQNAEDIQQVLPKKYSEGKSEQKLSAEYREQVIIKSKYLSAIQKIMECDRKQHQNRKNFPECSLRQFKLDFRFYLKERMQCEHFFSFNLNDGEVLQKMIGKEKIRENRDQEDDLMRSYYSEDRFVVLLENYGEKLNGSNGKQINNVINYLFNDTKCIEYEMKDSRVIKPIRKFRATFKDYKNVEVLIIMCIDIRHQYKNM